MASSRVSGELAFYTFLISFGFQREIEAGVQLQPPIPEGLLSQLKVKFKHLFTPPGVATRNAWGPILFKYCPVQYDGETRHLKIKKPTCVGNCKPTRHMSLLEDLKCDAFMNDDDEIHHDNDDVDNDDEDVPVDVVADDIWPGLCFLFNILNEWKHLGGLVRSLSCTSGQIFPNWN